MILMVLWILGAYVFFTLLLNLRHSSLQVGPHIPRSFSFKNCLVYLANSKNELTFWVLAWLRGLGVRVDAGLDHKIFITDLAKFLTIYLLK